jgi:hypothetical protein
MIIVDYMRYQIMLYLPVLLYLHLYLPGGRRSATLSARNPSIYASLRSMSNLLPTVLQLNSSKGGEQGAHQMSTIR